eukprot:gene21474-28447_t
MESTPTPDTAECKLDTVLHILFAFAILPWLSKGPQQEASLIYHAKELKQGTGQGVPCCSTAGDDGGRSKQGPAGGTAASTSAGSTAEKEELPNGNLDRGSKWRLQSQSQQPNYQADPFTLPRSLGMVTFLPALRHIRPPSMEWLWTFFSDLRPQQRHVGVDDRQHSWYRELKVQAARAVLKEGSITLCRSFCRFGVPHGLRASVWELALGLGPSNAEKDEAVLNDLCRRSQRSLLDICVEDDLQDILDSEHYFLFEESLRAIGLACLRDPLIVSRCSVELHPALAPLADLSAATLTGSSFKDSMISAVSQQQQAALGGVVPPKGFVSLAAPLCFMYPQPGSVYRLFRAMYCSLSSVGAPSPALPVLVAVFESLAQELDPEVVAHLHRMGIPVASLGMPWITSAFVGFLPVEEVLLLWDRVIGLDSLLPIPLLAVAVICFRRQVILTCSSTSEVLEAMSDLSQLQTVPLLQAVLFQG